MSKYQKEHSFEERKEKAKITFEKEPDKFILIIEKHPKSKLPDLPHSKMLCPKNIKYSFLKNRIESNIRKSQGKSADDSKESYYIFMNGQLPHADLTLEEIFQKYKQPDNIVYATYQEQQSF